MVDIIQVGPRGVPKTEKHRSSSPQRTVRYEENAGILTKSAINGTFPTSACSRSTPNVQTWKCPRSSIERVFCTLYASLQYHGIVIVRPRVDSTSPCKHSQPNHSMPYVDKQVRSSGAGVIALSLARLCRRWKVPKTRNERDMMQSLQSKRVGACPDSRPFRCRNLYRHNTDAEEAMEQRPFVFRVHDPGCCKPLRYLEIRNRV